MRSIEIANSTVREQRSATSRWVVLTRDAAYIDDLLAFIHDQQRALGLPRDAVGLRRPDERAFRSIPVWTDDYSNLFGLLKSKGTD
jgi:hypothetical protein